MQTAQSRLTRSAFLGATAAAAAVPLLGARESEWALMHRLLDIDPRYSGKGQTYNVGALVPLTGSGAIYGSHGTDIFKLAAKNIETLGGPKFNMIYKDNKSGDPQAGVQAMREFGAAGVPMMLSSYSADLGAALPGIRDNKIFTIDATGGTSQYAMNKPYFWGGIAVTPDDAFSGALKYITAKLPQVKTFAFVGWDLGPLSDIVEKDLLHDVGTSLKLVADERTKVGSSDYSAALQKVKAASPDIVFLAVYAQDVGYFMKQYATSGIGKPVVAFAHSQAAAKIAGSAYEELYFAFDYFDAEHPTNPYARSFIDSFKAAEYDTPPEFYAANFYEDAFILWECVRRVLKTGGDPRRGDQLEAAMRTNPTFPSVYGGDADRAGTLTFDLDTHSVKRRPMMVVQWHHGRIVPLAHFNIDGADFRLV